MVIYKGRVSKSKNCQSVNNNARMCRLILAAEVDADWLVWQAQMVVWSGKTTGTWPAGAVSTPSADSVPFPHSVACPLAQGLEEEGLLVLMNESWSGFCWLKSWVNCRSRMWWAGPLLWTVSLPVQQIVEYPFTLARVNQAPNRVCLTNDEAAWLKLV